MPTSSRQPFVDRTTCTDAEARFLADLSHEVRSPLNAITGFSELLGEGAFGPLTPEQYEVVRDILAAGRHLSKLLKDVFDISRMQMGRVKLHPEVLCVQAAVGQALILVGAALPGRKACVSHDLPLKLAVYADERRLVQVLANLLSNAVVHNPPGTAIGVQAVVEGEFIRFCVSDDGNGIGAEDQERIFEDFVTIDHGEGYQGTGLGLSVTRRLIEHMGGCLWLQSAPGQGAAFFFTLPVATAP